MYGASRGGRRNLAIAAVALVAGVLTQRAYPQQANGYVDPALCERCHAEIADNFRKTGMGRSFYRLRPGNAVEDFTPGKPFYHQASDSYFAMIERGGKYYQRRWQIGFDGQETNVEEKQVDFVMGSGNHGRSYLHLTSRNTLQELPLVDRPMAMSLGCPNAAIWRANTTSTPMSLYRGGAPAVALARQKGGRGRSAGAR